MLSSITVWLLAEQRYMINCDIAMWVVTVIIGKKHPLYVKKVVYIVIPDT